MFTVLRHSDMFAVCVCSYVHKHNVSHINCLQFQRTAAFNSVSHALDSSIHHLQLCHLFFIVTYFSGLPRVVTGYVNTEAIGEVSDSWM